MATAQHRYARAEAVTAPATGPGSRTRLGDGPARDERSQYCRTEVDDVESDYIDGFLELRPVWHRPTCPSDDPSPGHWGFIAEEVARIDPRLVRYTYADEAYEEVEVGDDGGGARRERRLRPGARRTRPDSVAYDRMTVLLQAVAKRQQAELETLEEELCALAARVEALEDAR